MAGYFDLKKENSDDNSGKDSVKEYSGNVKNDSFKKEIFGIIQIGDYHDIPSRVFDIFITVVIFSNLFALFARTFRELEPVFGICTTIESVTSLIFIIEYILRIWTADLLYPDKPPALARLNFCLSFYGIVELFSFLPFLLPGLMPSGMVAFRMLRVIRIFRLFQVSSSFDAFNIITDVLYEKKSQLISSMALIFILMLASSLCIYSLEHAAQPELFSNAFSGIWWSVSAMLTVGYGDIYPITPLGRIFAIITAFLGVGMVAIPTGIISAGFVEHFTKVQSLENRGYSSNMRFITINLESGHPWIGCTPGSTGLVPGMIMAGVIRDGESLLPVDDIVLKQGDRIIIGAENYVSGDGLRLEELRVKNAHPWAGKCIKELDISRQTLIVMIRRKNKNIIPRGSTRILPGDVAIICTRHGTSERY